MFNVTGSRGNAAMIGREGRTAGAAVKHLLLQNPDGLRDMLRAVV